MNVSREGIGYDTEEKVQFIQSLLSENQPVGFEMVLPLTGQSIAAKGRVRWYQTGSTDKSLEYLILMVGIFLDEATREDKRHSEHFIECTAASITAKET